MGLDASVMCTCYADGKAKPPPFAARYVVLRDGWPELQIPGCTESQECEFIRWLESACEHYDMQYAGVYVGNWRAVSDVRGALEAFDAEHSQTLLAESPTANGGRMTAQDAETALGELAHFRNHADFGEHPFLVDTDRECETPFWGADYGGGEPSDAVEFDVDTNGFVIRGPAPFSAELFRSRRFEQRIVTPAESRSHKPVTVAFMDIETGVRFVGHRAVSIEPVDGHIPARLHVEMRRVTANYYSAIIDELTLILEASVATGNPVRWC